MDLILAALGATSVHATQDGLISGARGRPLFSGQPNDDGRGGPCTRGARQRRGNHAETSRGVDGRVGALAVLRQGVAPARANRI